jgi:hypothetical protein
MLTPWYGRGGEVKEEEKDVSSRADHGIALCGGEWRLSGATRTSANGWSFLVAE